MLIQKADINKFTWQTMISINGLEEITDKLDSLAQVSGIDNAIEQACALIEASAKQKAPKDTGALRRSITSKVEQGNGTIEGVVFTPLEYAPYVEYGTGLFAENGGRMDVPWNYQDDEGNWHSTNGMKPQPFMMPAFYENREKILQLIKEGITK